MGLARRLNFNPYTHEYPPSFAAPLAMQNDKGIFRNEPNGGMALDDTLKPFACAWRHFERRCEMVHRRFKLPMGQVHGSDR